MSPKDPITVVAGPATVITRAIIAAFTRVGDRVVGVGPPALSDDVAFDLLVEADLAVADDIDQAVQEIRRRSSSIAAWVNVVPPLEASPAVDVVASDWDQAMARTLSSAFHAARCAGRVMLEQKSGSIVNVTSVHGLFAQQRGVLECTAAAGVNMLTKVLASEWGGGGVRVNAVAAAPSMPAPVAEPGDTATRVRLLQRSPMGRLADPEDVAEAVLFLARDEASFVTGEVLRVDGGWTAYHLFHPFDESF